MPADTLIEYTTAARSRLRSAVNLLSTADGDLQHLSSACYLAGYTVEMMLKAAVIKFKWEKKRGTPRLSRFTDSKRVEPSCPTCNTRSLECRQCGGPPVRTETREKYKHHDLRALVKALQQQPELRGTFKGWYPKNETSALFTTWNPELRYDSVWIKDVRAATDFMREVREFYQIISTELGQGATR